MASVRERKGRFTGLYRDRDGKQCSAGTFDDARAALKAAEAHEAVEATGRDAKEVLGEPEQIYPASKRGAITVAAYGRKWLDGARLEDTSRATYRSAVNRITEHIGALPLKEVEASGLRPMFRQLEKRYSSATVHITATVARELFRTAIQDKHRADNPMDGVKITPRRETERVIATPEQARQIWGTIDAPYRLMIETMFLTGMRWSEAVAVRGKDIEQRGSGYVLHIRRTIVETNGRLITRSYGKTGRSMRTISIDARLAKRLMDFGQEPCFTTRHGATPRRANFSRVWRKAADPVVPGLTVHGMRHSHASWLANDPAIPLARVCERLGHSSLAVTSRYIHVTGDGDDPILGALERMAA